jgi:bifunctional lysine-specific demethylase and histidyl-hydroxylase NO66
LFDIMHHAADLIDVTSDQMGKRYISDRLPPVLTSWEEEHSAEGCHEFAEDAKLKEAIMYGRKAVVKNNGKVISSNGGVRLRMLRQGLARLCIEDGVAVVYHCMDNARWHHGAEMKPLEFPIDDAPAIGVLISAYPVRDTHVLHVYII